MLTALGWVLWLLAVLALVAFVRRIASPNVGGEDAVYHRIAAIVLAVGTIPGLLLTTVGGWAKLHLLWLIPASYVALCLVVILPLGLLAYRVKKQGYRLRWFKKTPDPKPSFPIGSYTLNMILAGGPPFREFSAGEYEAMGREFVGEKIYHAPDVEFVGRPWNLTLGTVQGSLYKIAPFLELGNKTEANEVAFRALTFCMERLGKPAEQRTGFFVWDTTDGNVILQTAECKDGFAVNLFLTSREVRGFKRLA